MKISRLFVYLSLLITCKMTGAINPLQAAEPAAEPETEPWQLTGSITLQGDHYDNVGNPAVSPYAYEKGHLLSTFDLNINRNFSDYESIDAQLSGRVNASDYVTDYKGVVLDRGSMNWQKGDAPIPFRATGGDFYAFTTPRTLQRALKGGALELQPHVGMGRKLSMLVLAGGVEPAYRTMSTNSDTSSGFSLLGEDEKWGALTISLIKNRRENDPGMNLASLDQSLYGVAYARTLEFFSESFAMETEWSHFDGELDGAGMANPKADGTLFFELSRQGAGPLSVNFIHERTGRDFQSRSTTTSADRRSDSLDLGWGFENGLRLKGRLNDDRTSWSQTDPSFSRSWNTGLSGPLPSFKGLDLHAITFSYDLTRRHNYNRSHTSEATTDAHKVTLNTPLWQEWNAAWSSQYQDNDNLVNQTQTLTRSYGVTVNRSILWQEWRGSIAPGLLWRGVDAPTSLTHDLGLTLGLNLAKDPHSLRLNLGSQQTLRLEATNTDLLVRTNSLQYSYTNGPHQLTLIGDMQERDDDATQNNNAYHLGFRYAFRFDTKIGGESTEASTTDFSAAVANNEPFDLASLIPGMPMEQARSYLSNRRGAAAANYACCETFALDAFPRIPTAQRIYLEKNNNGTLTGSGVIIESPTGNVGEIEHHLHTVIGLISQHHGAPRRVMEEGQFANDPTGEIKSGRVVRLYEWRLPSGTLRLGIPARMDGALRIEMRHQRHLPSMNDPYWSKEEVL